MKNLKLKFKCKKFFLYAFCFFVILFFTKTVSAAKLYLETAQNQYKPNDTVMVKIKIDAENECLNTFMIDLDFNPSILQYIDFNTGQSLINLWLKAPQVDSARGLISFIGGVPGGYCGKILGESRQSDILGEIIFKIPSAINNNQTEINFIQTTQVLLNNGLGESAKLQTEGINFVISNQIQAAQQNEWLEQIARDNIPPESFNLEISQDPDIFENKFFLSFSTTDKQTGVEKYEIKEGEQEWKNVSSPYLLEDQNLRSIIKVRATDKAGNERIAEYLPKKKISFYWLIVPLLVLAGIIYWLYKKLKVKA